jgi:hypothetical protein
MVSFTGRPLNFTYTADLAPKKIILILIATGSRMARKFEMAIPHLAQTKLLLTLVLPTA